MPWVFRRPKIEITPPGVAITSRQALACFWSWKLVSSRAIYLHLHASFCACTNVNAEWSATLLAPLANAFGAVSRSVWSQTVNQLHRFQAHVCPKTITHVRFFQVLLDSAPPHVVYFIGRRITMLFQVWHSLFPRTSFQSQAPLVLCHVCFGGRFDFS